MTTEQYQQIQNQMKQQPGTTAAEICRRLNVPIAQYYTMRSKLKNGKKIGRPRKSTTIPHVFSVPTAPTRARVVVIQCWADEISDVLKGLQ